MADCPTRSFIPKAALRLCLSADSYVAAEICEGGPRGLRKVAKIRMVCKEWKKQLPRTETYGFWQGEKRNFDISASGNYQSAQRDGG